MSSRASLNAPPGLRETWRQLDQGILPEHLGGKPNPKSTASQPTMPDSRTKVAIIGYGLSAKIFHIPLILALPDSYTLHGIVQRNPTSTSSARTDHPSITTYRTVDAMLADAAVDLVIVTTTPETHFELASQALESGKHVVVEKPFVPTSAEARKLSALAKAKGLLLAVYQNRRWDVDFLTLKQVLTQGTLGHVAEFESHFDRFRPSVPEAGQVTWKNKVVPAGGALFDLGSHLIDQVYALYGVPKSVWGVVQVQKKGLKIGQVAPDACTVVLRYGSEEEETLVTVKSSSISAGETLRYWVRGDKGSFKKHHLDPQEDQLKSGLRPGDKGFGYEDSSRHAIITLPTSSSSEFTPASYPSVEPTTYVEYYRILAKAIQGKGEVPVSADEAADVLSIIEKVIESSDTGRAVAWDAADGRRPTMI